MTRYSWRSWLFVCVAAGGQAMAQTTMPSHPATEPPVPDSTPPANGNLTDKLSKSDGTIKPPPNEDPGMTAKSPPKTNDPMPVVPAPPVTNSGDMKPEPK